jgi:hypothetical protein
LGTALGVPPKLGLVPPTWEPMPPRWVLRREVVRMSDLDRDQCRRRATECMTDRNDLGAETLASRILALAQGGERDPDRLRDLALLSVGK